MFKRFNEIDSDVDIDATQWLIDELYKVDGATDFIYAAREVLGLTGSRLVWFVGMFDNFHNHPDYLMSNLIRTRVHFKKIAMSKLDENDYKSFRAMIKNWSEVLAVCRYLDPKWSTDERDI